MLSWVWSVGWLACWIWKTLQFSLDQLVNSIVCTCLRLLNRRDSWLCEQSYLLFAVMVLLRVVILKPFLSLFWLFDVDRPQVLVDVAVSSPHYLLHCQDLLRSLRFKHVNLVSTLPHVCQDASILFHLVSFCRVVLVLDVVPILWWLMDPDIAVKSLESHLLKPQLFLDWQSLVVVIVAPAVHFALFGCCWPLAGEMFRLEAFMARLACEKTLLHVRLTLLHIKSRCCETFLLFITIFSVLDLN